MGKTNVPSSACPSCGKFLDNVKSVSDAAKTVFKPGDFTVCASCGALCRFDAEMARKLASDEDWRFLRPAQQAMIRQAQERIREVGRGNN